MVRRSSSFTRCCCSQVSRPDVTEPLRGSWRAAWQVVTRGRGPRQFSTGDPGGGIGVRAGALVDGAVRLRGFSATHTRHGLVPEYI
jgi:hypothetical protein